MSNSINNQKNMILEVDRDCLKPIRERFETLLLKSRLRQSDLARILEVDKAYVCRIVNGKQMPVILMKVKIADALKVDSSEIWRNNNEN